MANNKFIDKILLKLSLTNPRLQCPITRLHIQIEMQYSTIQFIINYLIMLQPEYRYNWKINKHAEYKCMLYLCNIPAFEELKTYMTKEKLLSFDEADWLDDAIHEILVDDE
jgi:hypothetical protein